jgi:hypothetical protein
MRHDRATRVGWAVLLSALLAAASAPAQDLKTAIGDRIAANAEGVASQKRIDQLSDDTDALVADYRTTIKQTESLRVYNKQMSELIDSQEAEMASLQDQLDRVELVGRGVTPLMLRMIDALDAFVELDVPFLKTERTERLENLRDLMGRADVTNAEKYRAILEAYQIENEYGRTIEAYRATIDTTGEQRTVDFLRVGRIALVYQTLDGNESGVWDQKEHRWEKLDDSYRTSIREGIRVARKQTAPEMIRLPLPAAPPLGGQG